MRKNKRAHGILLASILAAGLAGGSAWAVPAEITAVPETLFLGGSQNSAELWVQVNDAAKVWGGAMVEIHPPTAPIREGVILPCSAQTQPHSCRDTVTGFEEAGRYEVLYRVFDKDTQLPGLTFSSTVYKARAGNHPPLPFIALVPVEGVGTRTQLRFDWQTTRDPDGDPFTYAFLISTQGGAAFYANVVYKQEHLSAPLLYVDDQAVIADGRSDGTLGLRDLTNYYWKVVAVDAYGAITESGPPMRFFTDNATNVEIVDACREQQVGCGQADLMGLTPGARMLVDAVWGIDKWYRVELVYNGGMSFSLDLARVESANPPGQEGARFYYAEGTGRLFIPTARVAGLGSYRAEMFLDNPAAWRFTVTELCSGVESVETTICFRP